MAIECKLCRRSVVDVREGSRCQCGWRLDENCYESHSNWCPDGDTDPWIGAVEF